MSFYGNEQVVVRNCNFDENTEVNEVNSTTSKWKPYRQSFLSFEETTAEFYSCDFLGLKNKDQLIYSSKSNFTLMNIDVQGIRGSFMNATGCNVQIAQSHFNNNNGTVLILNGAN